MVPKHVRFFGTKRLECMIKDTCALSKGTLDQMQAQSSRLGRERMNATLGGQHFGEPQVLGYGLVRRKHSLR